MTILHNSLSAAVLIVVIALVRALTLHRLPKNTFCILWTAAALRLLLPFSIESEYSFFTFLRNLFLKSSNRPVMFAAVAPLEGAKAELGNNASESMLPVLWLAGTCLLAGFFLLAYLRDMGIFRQAMPVDRAGFPVEVRQSGRISGPLTYGLFRPVILLPGGMDDPETRSLVLAHEYAHVRRHDCLWKLLFVAALCVHWFNPAAWVLCWLANRDMELACDEAAIRSLGEASRFAYAKALLAQAEHTPGFLPLFSHFGSRAVKERITAALKQRKRSMRRTLAACLLVTATLTVFATSAAAKLPVPPPRADGSYFPRELGLCISFRSDDPAEFSDTLKLTTLTGEPYTLANGEFFTYYLNDQAVERGTVYGTIRKESGNYLVLEAEFSLLSLNPLIYTVGDNLVEWSGEIEDMDGLCYIATTADR